MKAPIDNETLPLISIIVPAYNAEDTIARCLDSLVNQTYINTEILVIDDGSDDATKQIVESYCRHNSNVIYIAKSNGGQSSARNEGLDRASGSFIMFCDADDFVSCHIVEFLLTITLATNADIAECTFFSPRSAYTMYQEIINDLEFEYPEMIVKGNADIVKMALDYGFITVAPWGKLYSKRLIYNIRFAEEYRKSEDDDFIVRIAEHANIYARINLPLYAYCFNDNSIMHSEYSKNDLQIIDIYKHRIDSFHGRCDDELEQIIMYRYLIVLNSIIAAHKKHMPADDYRLIVALRDEAFQSWGSFPGCKRKALALISTLFPYTVYQAKKLKKACKTALREAYIIAPLRWRLGHKSRIAQ